jgi:peptidoglycan/LPS O-acetylase OafA/YrhL
MAAGDLFGLSEERLYYGSDTRAAGLLFGAALACLLPLQPTDQRYRPQLDLLGLAGLAGLTGL